MKWIQSIRINNYRIIYRITSMFCRVTYLYDCVGEAEVWSAFDSSSVPPLGETPFAKLCIWTDSNPLVSNPECEWDEALQVPNPGLWTESPALFELEFSFGFGLRIWSSEEDRGDRRPLPFRSILISAPELLDTEKSCRLCWLRLEVEVSISEAEVSPLELSPSARLKLTLISVLSPRPNSRVVSSVRLYLWRRAAPVIGFSPIVSGCPFSSSYSPLPRLSTSHVSHPALNSPQAPSRSSAPPFFSPLFHPINPFFWRRGGIDNSLVIPPRSSSWRAYLRKCSRIRADITDPMDCVKFASTDWRIPWDGGMNAQRNTVVIAALNKTNEQSGREIASWGLC